MKFDHLQYINIAYPMQKNWLDKRKTQLLILILYGLPPCLFFLIFSVFANQGFRSSHCDNRMRYDFYESFTYRSLVSALILIPFIIMVVLYAHMFMILKRKSMVTSSKSTQMAKKRRTIITTIFIVLTFGTGWLPSSVSFLLMCRQCPLPLIHYPFGVVFAISLFGIVMILTKTLINPIIYAVRIPELKDASERLRLKLRLKRKTSDKMRLNGQSAVDEMALIDLQA